MKDIRISRLILNLNKDELELIQKSFERNKQKLFIPILEAILQLKEKELSREEIYLRVYKKKHNAKNDATFRNHLSDMANIIEELIIRNSLNNADDSSVYLTEQLKLYQRLHLYKECESTLKKIREHGLQHYNYHVYLNALYGYAQFANQVYISFEDRYEKMKFTFEESKYFMSLQHDLNVAQHQYNKGLMMFASFFNNISNNIDKEEIKLFDENINKAISPIGRYLELAGICNMLLGATADSLHYYESYLQIAKEIYKTNTYFVEQYFETLSIVAKKYRNIGDFEKSNIYYEEMFMYISKVAQPNTQALFVNYISNLIKLKKHNDALQRITFVETAFPAKLKGNQVQLAIVKMMCYTYLEKPAELHKIIIENEYAELSDIERIYFRQTLCNAYLMENNFEMAETELNNLFRSKLMKSIDTDILLFAKSHQFIILKICKNQKIALTPHQLIQLKKEQANINFEKLEVLKHYTPYLWLIEKLGIN